VGIRSERVRVQLKRELSRILQEDLKGSKDRLRYYYEDRFDRRPEARKDLF